MRETGKFIGGGRWAAKVELLPGEFEVFDRRARHKGRLGQLIFTNQRFIWRPSFRRHADETEILLVPHERVNACDITRPWQQLFLERALRLRLHDGETIILNLRAADTIIPIIRDYMSRERYRPGELFK